MVRNFEGGVDDSQVRPQLVRQKKGHASRAPSQASLSPRRGQRGQQTTENEDDMGKLSELSHYGARPVPIISSTQFDVAVCHERSSSALFRLNWKVCQLGLMPTVAVCSLFLSSR